MIDLKTMAAIFGIGSEEIGYLTSREGVPMLVVPELDRLHLRRHRHDCAR
jgi:hypothetical protein